MNKKGGISENRKCKMTVIIYTKSGCPYCEEAKESFQKLNIDFCEINVSKHPDKIDELVLLTGVRRVPVIVDNSQITVGFNGGG